MPVNEWQGKQFMTIKKKKTNMNLDAHLEV